MRFLLVVTLSALVFSSCSKSSDPASPAVNDSTAFPNHFFFDKDGNPYLGGWTFHASDPDELPIYEKDVPPTGGTWSLKLHKSDVPNPINSVTETFTNLTSGVYELSVWTKMKYQLPGTNPLGSISISRNRSGVLLTASASSGDSTGWHPVVLDDTLTLVRTDSVTITLAGGLGDSSTHGNALWFNDITFRKK
jgi:hypothetical protein